MTPFVEWLVDRDSRIPSEVAAAAARGVPIVAIVPSDVPIDARAAELLEECAAVVRGDYRAYEAKLSGLMSGLSPSV